MQSEQSAFIHVGTSGFSFDDWKGSVYPPHLKKGEWLTYYEKVLGFKTLELNFTYYALPSPRALAGLSAKTSEDFLFSVKAFKGLTHDSKGMKSNPSSDYLARFDRFNESLRPLVDAGKLICVLAQFPFSFYPLKENLDYLKLFKERMRDIPLTVEFRNRYWLQPHIFDFLRLHLIGYCVVDEPKLPQLIPFYPAATSPIAYFRFHGRNTSWFKVPASVRYNYLYSPEELRSFLSPVKSIAAQSKSLFIFFNNCHAGSAAQNATMFVHMLHEEQLP